MWFLPAYSQDLNLIEEAFSKIKAYLRKVGAGGKKALMEAMSQALRIVTSRDAAGWLAHCGYRFRGQPS